MIKRKCKTCGKTFWITPATAKKGKGKYCSRKCWIESKGSVKKRCLYCGTIFVATQSRIIKGEGRYCSFPCAVKGQQKRKTLKCKICGKLFVVRDYRKKGAKYCSYKCYWKSMASQLTKKCALCGKEFTYNTFRSKKQRFCSLKCRDKSMQRRMTRKCLICGKEYIITRNRAQTAKYCSLKCVAKAYLGKGSPRWTGGVWHEYTSDYIKEIKDAIKARDGFKCLICGKKHPKHKLTVHHADMHKLNNDQKNLITYCMYCHLRIHKNLDSNTCLAIKKAKLSALAKLNFYKKFWNAHKGLNVIPKLWKLYRSTAKQVYC